MTPNRTKERMMIKARYTEEKRHRISDCPGSHGYSRSTFERSISSIEITDDLSAVDASALCGVQLMDVARGVFKLNGKEANAILRASIAKDARGVFAVCDWRFDSWA